MSGVAPRVAPTALFSQVRSDIIRDKYAISKLFNTLSVCHLILWCLFSSVTYAAKRFDTTFVWEGWVTLHKIEDIFITERKQQCFIHWYTENYSANTDLIWISAQGCHNGIWAEIADTRSGVVPSTPQQYVHEHTCTQIHTQFLNTVFVLIEIHILLMIYNYFCLQTNCIFIFFRALTGYNYFWNI